MTTIQDIQQAIRQLTRIQREDLAEWILNSADFSDRIAEAPAAYGVPREQRRFSLDEYLRIEEESAVNYEYLAGDIFAMSCPMLRHEVLVANLLGSLHGQLRGGPCKVFSSNTKLRLRGNGHDIVYHPDVTIACGPFSEDALSLQYLTNPCVVIEVLAPATEAIDRREKLLNYRHAPSLEEYVVIAQRPSQVTVYRRDDDWQSIVLTGSEAVMELRSVDVNLTLAEIYEGTR
jgi:Uma2 family endonuclease